MHGKLRRNLNSFYKLSQTPTPEDLYKHTLRATYQAGHVWAQACEKDPIILPPENCGWSKTSTGAYVPFWTDLDEALVSHRHRMS